MLKEIADAAFVRAGLRRWRLLADGRESEATWATRRLRALQAAQAVAPVALLAHERGVTWAFEGRVYRTDAGLTQADVLALVRERERRARRRLERAHAQLAQEDAAHGHRPGLSERGAAPPPRRQPIPRAVRLEVFQRDGGRCVQCGATFELQFDHVIPLSLGGASSAANLQVLCADCNRRKGASPG
jgi:5-methylcytosine-specific restriction endonuclease McrA